MMGYKLGQLIFSLFRFLGFSSSDSEHELVAFQTKDKDKGKSHSHRRQKQKAKEIVWNVKAIELLILHFDLLSAFYEWLFEIGAGVRGMMTGLLIGLPKQQEENSGPVQLSKFLGRDKDDSVRRSAVSGKKILLKLEKTKEDKLAENNRNELLKFLNASYD
ncbi:UNVERIFIED_CONTAM: hypothetical protein Slati_0815800 [Sesamum latifolium]|uniref:Uncharacterized protein n=1 Tax=Sesamum latifolium TaxID=2727402 RepID=A0AAW2XR62_9LAMI